MRKGLLIGAGFSVELGMPTSQEFSQAFFSFLTPDKLKSIVEIMKSYEPYGDDSPTDKTEYDNLLGVFNQLWQENNGAINYETLIQRLEKASGYDHSEQRTKDHFIGKLKVLINESFYIFQKHTCPIFIMNKERYRQLFSDFAEEELWIFSLNHDIIIEMLCKDLGFELYVGGNKTFQLPFDNIGSKQMVTFTEVDNNESDFNNLYFARGNKGINLLKLHGGINEFTYDNGKKRLFLLPAEEQTSLEYLNELDDFWHRPHYYHNGRTFPVEGEIVIGDTAGIMQFLRPAILSGAVKYSPTIAERKGEEKMIFFSKGIEQLDELYIIGYGFGDVHINNRIVRAMHLNQDMKIWVVNPHNTKIELLNPFDYNLRVRGITANTINSINYMTTEKWIEKEIGLELESAQASRSTIYERFYNVVFKR